MFRILLSRFLESYFNHRWLYLLPSLLMLIVAGVYFYNLEPRYVTSGTLYVQQDSLLAALNSVTRSDASMWVTPAQNTATKINELIRTDAFVRAVIYKTDLEARMNTSDAGVEEVIEETRSTVWALALGSNQVQITASQESPQVAVQLVNAVIESYIQWQVNGQRSESEAAQAFFAEQITKYSADLEAARQDIKAYLEANPAPLQGDRPEIERLEVNRLQKAMDRAESRYLSAQEKEENARLALAQIESDTRQSYMIIDAARLPEKPEISRRELAMRLAIFLLVGMILDVVAVVGGMILDQSFRFPLEVKKYLDLPVLAVVPDVTVRVRKRLKLFQGRKEKALEEPEALPAPSPVAEILQTLESEDADNAMLQETKDMALVAQATDEESERVKI